MPPGPEDLVVRLPDMRCLCVTVFAETTVYQIKLQIQQQEGVCGLSRPKLQFFLVLLVPCIIHAGIVTGLMFMQRKLEEKHNLLCWTRVIRASISCTCSNHHNYHNRPLDHSWDCLVILVISWSSANSLLSSVKLLFLRCRSAPRWNHRILFDEDFLTCITDSHFGHIPITMEYCDASCSTTQAVMPIRIGKQGTQDLNFRLSADPGTVYGLLLEAKFKGGHTMILSRLTLVAFVRFLPCCAVSSKHWKMSPCTASKFSHTMTCSTCRRQNFKDVF